MVETNFEHYKDDILKIVATGLSVAVIYGKPTTCHYGICSKCDLNKGKILCSETRKNWFESKYKKP